MQMEQPEKTDASNPIPEIPEWFQRIVSQVNDGAPIADLSRESEELYELYIQAQAGAPDSAWQIGDNFETGLLPGGPSLDDAMNWYRYAANMGSAKAAFRLSQLEYWQARKRPDAGLAMALLGLKNLAEDGKAHRSWKGWEGWNVAARILLRLLETGAIDDGNESLQQLMSMKGFVDHPDFEEIAAAVRRLSARNCKSGLSVSVIRGQLNEDGEFKSGIYKTLEKPLALVPAPADVNKLLEALNAEFPWFADINRLVCRQLAVAQQGKKPAFRIRPLLLAGPPGVGKTAWTKRLAELCNVPFRSVMAGGGNDSMFLRGTPRGWSSARPGAVLQAIATEGIANPIFLVDELEKASSDNRNGRIWDVLLQLLEPSSARSYLDECLQMPCDLSYVTWFATVNELGALPKPLLDRFTVVYAEAPGKEHWQAIIKGAMNGVAGEMEVDPRMLPQLMPDDLEVLELCQNPREINRIVRLIMEQKMVEERYRAVH